MTPLRTAAPSLASLTLLTALAAVPLLAAMLLDARMFQGESVWLKPVKFHMALVIYFATLVIYARFLPPGLIQTRRWRIYLGVVIACVLSELVWLSTAGANATASHFNISTPLWAAIYPLMGLAAVMLTSVSLMMGLAIRRNRGTGLAPALHMGLWLGLILTFVLTVIVAGTMSAGTGHHVGTALTGARVPLMGWSREVGDLRVAHFLATHALHAIPLAGLLATRLLPGAQATIAVIAAAFGYTALVLGTFAQALAGHPLI